MNLATYIDHTLLKPEATRKQIQVLCAEAREHGFMSVCVQSFYVPEAVKELQGSRVKVCTVVGFPLGCVPSVIKTNEALWAIDQGAQEIDMVINIAAAKSGEWTVVEDEIKKLASNCHARGAILKVILETALLTDAEKTKACEIAWAQGADFVKTSTGFSTGGATIADVQLMRKVVGLNLGIKASGGIKDAATAKAMIEAGATRLGTSSGVAIVTGVTGQQTY